WETAKLGIHDGCRVRRRGGNSSNRTGAIRFAIAPYASSYLRPDAGLLDDRPPLLDFGLVQGAERLRPLLLGRKNLLADIGEALAPRRLRQSSNHGGIELLDDVLRRALGRPKSVPVGKIEAGQSRLVGGGNVLRERHAALGRDRIGFDAAGPDLRRALIGRGEGKVELAREQRLHHRIGAAIRHEYPARA